MATSASPAVAVTRCPAPSPGRGAIDRTRMPPCHRGAGGARPSHQAAVEAGRVQPAGALEHDAAVVGVRPHLGPQLGAGDESHGLAQLVAVLARHRLQRGHHALGVGEIQLAGARVVAGDLGRGTAGQRLDVVERLVDLGVEAAAQRAEGLLEGGRPRRELGDDHAAVARAGAPADGVSVEDEHLAPGGRQLAGRGHARRSPPPRRPRRHGRAAPRRPPPAMPGRGPGRARPAPAPATAPTRRSRAPAVRSPTNSSDDERST